jgi:hypothetical protein
VSAAKGDSSAPHLDARGAGAKKFSRGEVARRLGAPTDQQGSVNDPRTTEELGVKWNEKWIYREPERAGYDRIVLWNRYDLLGVWRIARDGSATPEALPEKSAH